MCIYIEDRGRPLREKCPYSELFCPHFPTFGLNTGSYSVSLRIQSECGKIRTRITPNTDTFYAVDQSLRVAFPKETSKSRPEVFFKKVLLKISQSSQENTCVRDSFLAKLETSACNFIKKETLAQVFSCEFCKISKNTFFYRTLLVAASDRSGIFSVYIFLFVSFLLSQGIVRKVYTFEKKILLKRVIVTVICISQKRRGNNNTSFGKISRAACYAIKFKLLSSLTLNGFIDAKSYFR